MEKDKMFKVEDVKLNVCRRQNTLDVEETGANLCRRPSLLDLPSTSRRSHGQFLGLSRNASRPSSRIGYDLNGVDASILHWDDGDIDSWLDDIDMKDYKWLFQQQAITTGRRLLSLTEEHLKEIGVVIIGHRLELSYHIDELRKSAGWISTAAFVDVPTLLNQSVDNINCEKTSFMYT